MLPCVKVKQVYIALRWSARELQQSFYRHIAPLEQRILFKEMGHPHARDVKRHIDPLEQRILFKEMGYPHARGVICL